MGRRRASAYERSPANAAVLEVVYTIETFQNYIVELDLGSLPGGSYCLTSPIQQLVTFNSLGESTCSNNSSLLFTLDQLNISTSKTDATCFNDADGAIDLTISSGTGPFQVDWDIDGTGDFDDLEDLTGLTAGIYKVTVVASNGCPVTDTAA